MSTPEFGSALLPERFWQKVQPDPATECWLWTGARNAGYGWFRFDGKSRRAYRVAYEVLVGPVPHPLQLDHTCHTRPCVNPAHLEPVTNAENARRGDAAHVIRTGRCKRGHERQADSAKCLTCDRERTRRLAADARRRMPPPNAVRCDECGDAGFRNRSGLSSHRRFIHNLRSEERTAS